MKGGGVGGDIGRRRGEGWGGGKATGEGEGGGRGGEYEKGRNDRSLRSGANLSAAKHTTDSTAARPEPTA